MQLCSCVLKLVEAWWGTFLSRAEVRTCLANSLKLECDTAMCNQPMYLFIELLSSPQNQQSLPVLSYSFAAVTKSLLQYTMRLYTQVEGEAKSTATLPCF